MTATLWPSIVYTLCLATSAACAWLLGRTYRRTRARLLFWSALCFALLAINNLFVILDLLVLPEMDLRLPRVASSLAAVTVLLYGFIWKREEQE
jgi:hypothetical protein